MNARLCLAPAAVLALAVSALSAENDLPKHQAGEVAESSAALFPKDIGDVLPGKELPVFELLAPEPEVDVEKARTTFERAQKKEQRWQKLAKSGVLSRAEAETSVLATARARARYERARVNAQQRALEEMKSRVAGGQLSVDVVTSAESALKTAETMAADAEANLRRTELLLAETNVERQRRLLTLGAGSKTQLKRAESALLQLKGPSH